jgi:hypothetical protein
MRALKGRILMWLDGYYHTHKKLFGPLGPKICDAFDQHILDSIKVPVYTINELNPIRRRQRYDNRE